MSTCLFVATVIILPSCVSVPKQAPLLSEELGEKINTLEKSHLNLLNTFFSERRKIVDQWDKVIASEDHNDRVKFLLIVGPRLQNAIDKKRRELVQPLDDLENQIAAAIREEYTVARSINASLTNYLHSAVKVSENQQRYLDKLNITEDRISKIIDQTDNIVEKLVETADTVVEKEEKASEYLEKIKAIKAQLLN